MRYSCFFLLLLLQLGVRAQDGSWAYYGKDAGGTRYSALKQINDHTVGRLQVAWTSRTGELEKYTGTHALEKAAFECTPILIGRTLYVSTPSNRVIALDGATGQQRWVYDPNVNMNGDFSEISNRGVAYWKGGRLFIGTIDGRLIALDVVTGKPAADFGREGIVDLRAGVGADIAETSPPTVAGDLVIVGSSLGDNQRFDYPPGVVRAYDVRSGKLVWTWNPIPTDPTDPAYSTWQGPKAHKTGGANAWSILSVDPARDMVFVPTTCPSPDYYGGERKGMNRYANSLVALRASTGKPLWSFQVVHHDIWDFDIAAQPILADIAVQGRGKVPAVIIGTKMGHVFVLNRETGVSLFPVEERPVPASHVKGEEAWPTQPFPVLPAPLGIQGFSLADVWGPTPEDLAEARRRISPYRSEGPFTPPGFEGSVMAPGNVGGINWSGMCYDPETGYLVTNINRIPAVIRMIPRDSIDIVERSDAAVMRAETGRQTGTPYIMKRDYLFKVDQRGIVMQVKPPWGTLVAIDLHDGSRKWEVPLGYMMDPAKYPDAKKWGSLNFGGAIITGGNCIFVAGSMDGHFRAFDRRTGAVLWEYALPAGGQATPMTYSLDGKQYVVIAAGGHGKLRTKQGDYVLAFALP
ncbi:pyrroloquinoline quinone-dependent dehydrogenase [Puia sp.]|jgi:quinoprotein glucose dehydrogenase|uniref:pyrroloquinoline quinone-dependent dehydrogenase n=1 Tax=Puia sp. TaxID=2045100 RepID=UPI002F429C52